METSISDQEIEAKFLTFMLNGQYDGAQFFLLNIKADLTRSPHTYYFCSLLLGICLQQKGDLRKARYYLNAVLNQTKFHLLRLRASIHYAKVLSQEGNYKYSSKCLESSLNTINESARKGIIDYQTADTLSLPILWRLGVEYKLMGYAKLSQSFLDKHHDKCGENLYQKANRYAVNSIISITSNKTRDWDIAEEMILEAQRIYLASNVETETAFANKDKPLVGMFFLHLMLKARMGKDFEAFVKSIILKHLMTAMNISFQSEGFSEMIIPMRDLKPQLQEFIVLEPRNYSSWIKKQSNKDLIVEAIHFGNTFIPNLTVSNSLNELVKKLCIEKGDFQNRDVRIHLMSDLSSLIKIPLLINSYPLGEENFEVSLHTKTFEEIICAIISSYKKAIEDKQAYKLLWNYVSNKPLNENSSQILFDIVARQICNFLNIDVSREVHTGRGIVDFKLSVGITKRALIEIKLGSNRKFWNGLSKQLPTYLSSENIKSGFLLGIYFTDRQQKYLHRIDKKHAKMCEDNNTRIILIDARKNRLTASKL